MKKMPGGTDEHRVTGFQPRYGYRRLFPLTRQFCALAVKPGRKLDHRAAAAIHAFRRLFAIFGAESFSIQVLMPCRPSLPMISASSRNKSPGEYETNNIWTSEYARRCGRGQPINTSAPHYPDDDQFGDLVMQRAEAVYWASLHTNPMNLIDTGPLLKTRQKALENYQVIEKVGIMPGHQHRIRWRIAIMTRVRCRSAASSQ